MKKYLLILIGLVLSVIMTGCGGFSDDSSQTDTHPEYQADTTKVTFVLGDRPAISALENGGGLSLRKATKITKDDILDNVKSVCLQVLVEDQIDPVYGKCVPVLDSMYPIIEADTKDFEDKVSSYDEFKVKIIGVNHPTDNYKTTYGILAESDDKTFDTIITLLLEQEVYMGKLKALDYVNIYIDVIDSTNQTDFSSYSKLTLVTEEGRTFEYSNDFSADSIWSEFWLEKGEEYKMLCLDTECYYIPEEFDFFGYESFDVSKAQKVDMTPVNSGDVCTIRYNQDFHKVIDMSPNKYNFEHYVSITDCDQSRYYFNVSIDRFENLSINLMGDTSRYQPLKSLEGGRYEFQVSSKEGAKNAYFYIQYVPQSIEVEGNYYYPSMTIEVVDKYSGEAVQSEYFDMTSFNYINLEE